MEPVSFEINNLITTKPQFHRYGRLLNALILWNSEAFMKAEYYAETYSKKELVFLYMFRDGKHELYFNIPCGTY